MPVFRPKKTRDCMAATVGTKRRIINQLGVGVHHNRRLVAVAHLRVVHRHHPVPAHPILEAHSVISAFHILEQQLPQQFRRRHNPLALLTVLRQLSLRLLDFSTAARAHNNLTLPSANRL